MAAPQLTLTAANSTFMLAIEGLFPVPVKVQGYATDAGFEIDAVEGAEVMKGVDGKMSAGWVPTVKRQTVTLQGDSPSTFLFEQWIEAMDAARELIWADGILTQPSIRREYILTRGVLVNYSRMSAVRRILQPRPFIIAWEDVTPTPLLT